MIGIAKVAGRSMLPRFEPGDYVLFVKPVFSGYLCGDYVLADHQAYGLILKRVCEVSREAVWVEGLNIRSASSAALGCISFEQLRGRVVAHLSKRDGCRSVSACANREIGPY